MSFELESNEGSLVGVAFSDTAATLYAVIRASDGYLWMADDSGWVAYALAAIGDVAIGPLVEQGNSASRYYTLEIPQTRELFVKGAYIPVPDPVAIRLLHIDVYEQAGASPADGDPHVARRDVWVELIPDDTVVIARQPSVWQEGVVPGDGSIGLSAFNGGVPTIVLGTGEAKFVPVASRDV